VLFWEGGAYLSTLAHDYEQLYAELCKQFGFPVLATVRGENE
jgi:hypothetical protein